MMFLLTGESLFLFQWIDYNKLNILGIHQAWIYYIIFTLAFLILFGLVQPLMTWMIRRRTMLLLTYVISSLLFLVGCLFIVFWPSFLADTTDITVFRERINIIKHVLVIVGVFGIVLASMNYIKYIIHVKN